MSIASRWIALVGNAGDNPLELERRLSDGLQRARSAWPGVTLDDDAFIEHVAGLVPHGVDPAVAIESLALAELFLACACARRDQAALRVLRADYVPALRAVLARAAPDRVEELCNEVLARLLVGEQPGIASYSGRGSLHAWLRVVGTRAVYRANRSAARRRARELSAVMQQLDAADSPELLALKQRYRTMFKTAFELAFKALEPQERNLLRHEIVDGLDTDSIATLYGVHRATIARWRADIRHKLRRGTQQYFRDHERARPHEVDSILALIESQLDVSLSRLLREETRQDV